MDFVAFRQRALAEGKRYGEDPLVFVREFAQNSRDAGATKIAIDTSIESGRIRLTFCDNGCGMTFEHARRFLFSLYASSKENETGTAGRFGVGFWSVLRLAPEMLNIESRVENGNAWSVRFDETLSVQERGNSALTRQGTRITIERRGTPEALKNLAEDISHTARRYCRHLRRRDEPFAPLHVICNGERIDRALQLDSPLWTVFRSRDIEGAVGLADRPSVSVYSRGLPVWQGTALEELRFGATRMKQPPSIEGLAPVYLLNGNNLSVTQDRRAVIDDAALARLRRVAEDQLDTLLSSCLDGIATRPLPVRIRHCFSRAVDRAAQWRAAVILPLLVALFGTIGVLALVFSLLPDARHRSNQAITDQPQELSASVAMAPLHERAPYAGARIDTGRLDIAAAIAYLPRRDLILRVATADILDAGRGAVEHVDATWHDPAPFICREDCVTLSVSLSETAGRIALPIPAGHRIEPDSVRSDSGPPPALQVNASHDVLVSKQKSVSSPLFYRTGPAPAEPLSAAARARYLQFPANLEIPPRYQPLLVAAAAMHDTADRVETIISGIRDGLTYDRSTHTAERFNELAQTAQDWLAASARIGAGDCDVKNTVALYLLRALQIPSRLAIGYQGENGRVRPGMHAWIEYYDNGWHTSDATGQTLSSDPMPISQGSATPSLLPDVMPSAQPAESTRFSDRWQSWFDGLMFRIRTLALVAPQIRIAIAVSLAGLLLALSLRVLRRFRRTSRQSLSPQMRHRIAARMLAGAIVHPGLWQTTGGIAGRRLVPVHGRQRPASLDEMRRLASRGELYTSDGNSPLAKRVIGAGGRVLNAADPEFGDIVSRFHGSCDLDAVDALLSGLCNGLTEDSRWPVPVIARADALLIRAGLPPGSIVALRGETDRLFSEVRLAGLPLRAIAPLRRRFIGVSIHHLEKLPSDHPTRNDDTTAAAFALVRFMLEQTDLFSAHAPHICMTAATRVLCEAPA